MDEDGSLHLENLLRLYDVANIRGKLTWYRGKRNVKKFVSVLHLGSWFSSSTRTQKVIELQESHLNRPVFCLLSPTTKKTTTKNKRKPKKEFMKIGITQIHFLFGRDLLISFQVQLCVMYHHMRLSFTSDNAEDGNTFMSMCVCPSHLALIHYTGYDVMLLHNCLLKTTLAQHGSYSD